MKFFFYFVLGVIGTVILLPILIPLIGGLIAIIGTVFSAIAALAAYPPPTRALGYQILKALKML